MENYINFQYSSVLFPLAHQQVQTQITVHGRHTNFGSNFIRMSSFVSVWSFINSWFEKQEEIIFLSIYKNKILDKSISITHYLHEI